MNILTFDQIYWKEYQEGQNSILAMCQNFFKWHSLSMQRAKIILNINQMQPMHGVDMSKNIVKLKKDQIHHKVGKRNWNACMLQFFPQM